MSDVITLIMAAGKGTRMKSNKSKLVHKIFDKELIRRVVDLAESINSSEIITVVGYLREQVIEVLGDSVKYAYQEELLGTGHAVMQAQKYLENKEGKVLILYGDVPLIRKETLEKLIDVSINNNEAATILTTMIDNPTGYGRIIRDENYNIKSIVEEKDATDIQRQVKEINSGIYCFNIKELLEALKEIKPNNLQGEYYLTDVIRIMNERKLKIGSLIIEDNTEVMGVNDRIQLAQATKVLQRRINEYHMRNGVTIINPETTFIYENVNIGKDTIINPGVIIKPNVTIGENCEIFEYKVIESNSIIKSSF